jgi:hypothetical protein
MSSDLTELGQEAIAAVSRGVADGAPLVKCQLLASAFYEALRHELLQADATKRSTLNGGCPVDEPAWMKLMTPISLGRKVVMLHCGRSSKKLQALQYETYAIFIRRGTPEMFAVPFDPTLMLASAWLFFSIAIAIVALNN